MSGYGYGGYSGGYSGYGGDSGYVGNYGGVAMGQAADTASLSQPPTADQPLETIVVTATVHTETFWSNLSEATIAAGLGKAVSGATESFLTGVAEGLAAAEAGAVGGAEVGIFGGPAGIVVGAALGGAAAATAWYYFKQ